MSHRQQVGAGAGGYSGADRRRRGGLTVFVPMSARALLRILAVGVLLLLAAAGWQLELSRQATIAQAERVASSLALTLDAQLEAVLRRIDADLHAIAGGDEKIGGEEVEATKSRVKRREEAKNIVTSMT